MGFNYVLRHNDNPFTAIHAEEDAVNKIKPHRKKPKIKLNLYLFCFRHDNTLKDVLPCSKCLNRLTKKMSFKGYQVKKVYYSVNGKIVNEYLDNLIKTKYFLLTTEKLTNNKTKKKLVKKKSNHTNTKHIRISDKFLVT